MKIEFLRTAYDVMTGKATTEEARTAAIQAIEDELTKNAAAKAAKADEYAQAWDAVREVLAPSAGAMTVADIFAKVESELPVDFGKGKVQYGITHQWAGEVVKIDGKPCTYRLK